MIGRSQELSLWEPLAATVAAHHCVSSLETIRRAYDVASRWHAGQHRKSGEPYVTHPVAVATIVAQHGYGPAAVCAALLHDLVDDTPYTFAQMQAEFGDEVTALVRELDSEPALRRLMQTAAPRELAPFDVGVAVIKLADRLHNMRTIQHVTAAKQIRKSRETLEFAAPIAHHLGLHDIKRELEDLALRVLRPTATDRPTRMMGRVLHWTVLALPADTRARWREEWAAEMTVPGTTGQRIRYVAHTLLAVPKLALTLRTSRPRSADGWLVLIARAIRLLGILSALVVITTPTALAAWIAGGLGVGALILTGTLLFARSDTPARRLAELIRAWRQ